MQINLGSSWVGSCSASVRDESGLLKAIVPKDEESTVTKRGEGSRVQPRSETQEIGGFTRLP